MHSNVYDIMVYITDVKMIYQNKEGKSRWAPGLGWIQQVEDIMDEVNTFVRIDAQHREFWQADLTRGRWKTQTTGGDSWT